MTIICATRFSEESSFAARVAADLARKQKQTLWLVHVLPGRVMRSWSDRLEAAASSSLEAEATALRQQGLDVQTAVLTGKLDDAISRFCAEKSASLLVVGDTTRAVGVLGANTLDKLAYSVEAPLLVVRDPRPFHAWVDGKAPLKVMLALDQTSSAAIARDWIIRLAKFGALDLVAAHVWWPIEEYERRGLPVPALEEGHKALSAVMAAEAAQALKGLPANVKVRTHLEMGVANIADHLLALANQEQVDVVVLGTHRRRALGRLWSVSHQVLALAPMAVACIPSTVAVPDLSTVPEFRSALAATNFTEAGNRAITMGLGLVGTGTLHVVHVAQGPLTVETETALLKKLVVVLPPEAERKARVLVHVVHGEVAKELVATADRLGAQVVCLGLKAGALLKSTVASEVLARAGRPVMFAAPVKA